VYAWISRQSTCLRRADPYLVAGGRRVVTFDFLGFGASDKPSGATYSFKRQLGDMEAVVDALGLDKIVPVPHDSSGPAAINFTLAHPERVMSLCILNSGYDDALPILWPEMITLFATKSLHELAMAIAQSPEQFGWLVTWQRKGFRSLLPASLQTHFDTVTAPLSLTISLNSRAPVRPSCNWPQTFLRNSPGIQRACLS
jgi:haloalkane dehalogenase